MKENSALPANQLDENEAKLKQQKDNFISIVSHELRTPLGIIRGYVQLTSKRMLNYRDQIKKMQAAHPECSAALDSFDLDRDIEQLKSIIHHVDKINRLLNELLDTSMFETSPVPMAMQFFSLEKLSKKVIRRYKSFSPIHQISLTKTTAGKQKTGSAIVFGDTSKIDMVLSHLILNAINYSPQGGEIKLKITHEINRVLVEVKDEGIGIPPEELPDIFYSYYRAKNSRQVEFGGLGVGLYLCKRIINQHGGNIWAESRLNEGSTFSFWLPKFRPN